uniref:Chaperone n=1 Tax=viral metagenome TaxID=1070528 RepID=A0A6C0DT46_9ZZZZ
MTLYERLEVSKTASPEEIKKAFYRLSKATHPDKGGDAEAFKAISQAYEILSDPDKRRHYDMTGSIDEGGGGGGPVDLSEMFGVGGNPFGFGGGMPFGGDLGAMFGSMFGGGQRVRRKAAQGPDKTQDLPLKLSDFYNGRTIPITFQQQRACGLCKASGALKSESCNGCKGAGMKMFMRQLGPGMIQQGMAPCSDCSGEGKRIIQVCHECNGRKYKADSKTLDARILPGMAEGEKIRFHGECSDSPDYETPGDVVLNLIRAGVETEADLEWKGSDLHTTHSVEVGEALLGFNAVVKGHPTGKEISLSWGGGLLQHEMVLMAKGLGMPVKGKPGQFGDLFVHIEISVGVGELKRVWTEEERVMLRTLFPDWEVPSTGGIPLGFQPPA